MQDKTAANKSVYQHIMYLCGLLFGANQIALLKFKVFDFDLLYFFGYLISILILFALISKKYTLTQSNEELATLSRGYAHILADWLCATGLVTLLTISLYVFNTEFILDQYWFIKYRWIFSINSFNLLIGLIILSHYAHIERAKLKNADNMS
jgi:hypothetical protein